MENMIMNKKSIVLMAFVGLVCASGIAASDRRQGVCLKDKKDIALFKRGFVTNQDVQEALAKPCLDLSCNKVEEGIRTLSQMILQDLSEQTSESFESIQESLSRLDVLSNEVQKHLHPHVGGLLFAPVKVQGTVHQRTISTPVVKSILKNGNKGNGGTSKKSVSFGEVRVARVGEHESPQG
jgi:hypothetical protein